MDKRQLEKLSCAFSSDNQKASDRKCFQMFIRYLYSGKKVDRIKVYGWTQIKSMCHILKYIDVNLTYVRLFLFWVSRWDKEEWEEDADINVRLKSVYHCALTGNGDILVDVCAPSANIHGTYNLYISDPNND